MLTPEYIAYKKLVEKKRKHVGNMQFALATLLKECTHEEIEQKSSYYPGGYYDTSYTDYWNQCKLCGVRSEKTTENHGSYG